MSRMPLTAADACRLLRRAGYPMTERRLVDWRAQGHLPAMKRESKPVGGRGAHYVWPHPEILAHIVTLIDACDVRYRMETADVLAWFAGFDYPTGFIREKWASFERLGLDATVRRVSAGEPLSLDDAVPVIVAEARQERAAQRFSQAFVDTLTRMEFDPKFDASIDVTARLAAIIRSDLLRMARIHQPIDNEEPDLTAFVTPERVRALFIVFQDYWSPPRFGHLLERLPEELLAKAHEDCRTILMPYREWLTDLILQGNGQANQSALAAMVPMIVARVGRMLLKLDILLRSNELGSDVDATVSAVRTIYEDPWVRAVFQEFRREYSQVVSTDEDDEDHDVFMALIESRKDSDPKYANYARLMDRCWNTVESVGKLWWPHLRTALERTAAS